MKIKATFTGTNNSLGYITGAVYELYISVAKEAIAIHRIETGTGACVYANIITFLKNWTDIKTTI